MIVFFLLSAGIALLVTLAVYYAASLYYRGNAMKGDTLHLIRLLIEASIGDFNAFVLVFLPIFFVTYLLLTRNYGKMLDDISKGISAISNGNFDVNIPVNSNDEIGNLAADVNQAAQNLKMAVQSGEFAKSSKDRLVVNIAHDLRTPLTSINGYLNLILHKQGLTPEQIRHYAGIAYNKSNSMGRLIEELFDFTLYHYDESKLDLERIDISLLAKQIMDDFYPALIKREMEGRVFIHDSPLYIQADGHMIARVFDNLISNAMRYGQGGRYIDVTVFQDHELNMAVAQVVNYDSPIPPEEIDSIFETFYRMDKSRSQDTGGSGLGLAIAKNIVERHGGEIYVTSDFERTVFTMRFAALTPQSPS